MHLERTGLQMMLITREMEIRHLQAANLNKLAYLLDKNRWWEILMEIIPKNLQDINAADLIQSTKIIRKYSQEEMK